MFEKKSQLMSCNGILVGKVMQWNSCGEDNHFPTENISCLLWSLKDHYCLHMGTLQKKDERKF
jgi:hypothetical protein